MRLLDYLLHAVEARHIGPIGRRGLDLAQGIEPVAEFLAGSFGIIAVAEIVIGAEKGGDVHLQLRRLRLELGALRIADAVDVGGQPDVGVIAGGRVPSWRDLLFAGAISEIVAHVLDHKAEG